MNFLEMTDFEQEFFHENINKVNKIVQTILFASSVVPLIFLIFAFLGLFRMSYLYSICLFAYTFTCSVIEVFLNGEEKLKKVSMYLGLFFCCGIVFFLFLNPTVNPSIVLAIIPVISCLYYNKRLTVFVNILNFIFIAFASYFRLNEFHLGFIIGLLMELCFLTMCTYWLLEKTLKSHLQIFSLSQTREEIFNELQQRNLDLQNTQYKIIQFTGKCLGGHDYFTGRHVVHVQEYVELIATGLKEAGYYNTVLTNEEIKTFSSAAFLHDIGKLHVPRELLNKQSELTPEERAIIKNHTGEGKRLLDLLPQIDGGHFNEIAIQMAYSHHENWDGSGYPIGLKETTIPLCARILSVADALDKLITECPTVENSVIYAIKILDEQADKMYERCIVDVVIKLHSEIEQLVRQFDMRESVLNNEKNSW